MSLPSECFVECIVGYCYCTAEAADLSLIAKYSKDTKCPGCGNYIHLQCGMSSCLAMVMDKGMDNIHGFERTCFRCYVEHSDKYSTWDLRETTAYKNKLLGLKCRDPRPPPYDLFDAGDPRLLTHPDSDEYMKEIPPVVIDNSIHYPDQIGGPSDMHAVAHPST